MSLIIIASGIIAIIGMVFYISSIVSGKTTPHRTTRFIQFLILFLGTVGLFNAHDYPTFLLYCIYSTFALVISLLSLKWGEGGWTKTDIVCLLIALLGVAVWLISNNPLVAIVASVLASAIGTVPAYIKTYESPKSEYWVYYFCNLFSNSLIFFAHDVHTFSNSLPSVYYVIWNLAFLILIFRHWIKAKSHLSLHFKNNPVK